MQRGTITILIILGVAIIAATSSVLYHYSNQRHAQGFWGTQTASLIDRAPQVEVMRLAAADSGLAFEDEGGEPPPEDEGEPAPADDEPAAKALEFDGLVWDVVESKDAAPAKGIGNLRRALVLDTTYNWTEEAPGDDPNWQYALAVTDGHDWATVLFDFDSRQIALAGARRTAMLVPEAAEEFHEFFETQFTKREDADGNAARDDEVSEFVRPDDAGDPSVPE